MNEGEENALICARLLGWKQLDFELFDVDGTVNGRRIAPKFTTWAEAGLILDAMVAKRVTFDVYHEDEDFMTSFGGMPACISSATTGPLAIRAAALEYIRSLP
jgi:hypothetical protein